MEKPAAILSDADGTLVDTVRLIRHGQYETAITYLAQQGIPAADLPDYSAYEVLLNRTVGGSARDTLERTVRLLYEDKAHHLEGLDFDALHDLLDPTQDRIAPEFVRAYEGLSAFLTYLGDAGIKLAIFTSGTPHHVVRNLGIALPELGLTTLYQDKTVSDKEKLALFEQKLQQYFNLAAFTVVTCTDVTTHKPHPASLQLGMQRLGVQPEYALVLGDHKVDIQAGINAGVPELIGVTHGFNDRPTLEAAGATRVIDSLGELQSLLTHQ